MTSIAILTCISLAAFVLLMLIFIGASGIPKLGADVCTLCGRIEGENEAQR